MPETVIHNGEILVDGQAQPASPPPRDAKPRPASKPEDIEPEEIARRMAATVSLGIEHKLTPMEIVNSLLTLNSPNGHKLVWTRFDVHQTFLLWSKKLSGVDK